MSLGEVPYLVNLLAFLRSRRRLTTVALYAVSAAQPRLTNLILVVIFARYLSPADFGTYAVLVAFGTIIGMVADFGVPAAIVRNYYDYHGDAARASEYLSSVLLGSRLIALASMAILGTAMYLLWSYIGLRQEDAKYFVPLVIAYAYFERSANVLGALCRAAERPNEFALGRLTNGVTTVIVATVLVGIFRGGVGAALLALVAGYVVSTLTYMSFRRAPAMRWPIDWVELKRCLAFAIPIMTNQVLLWLRQPALRPILARLTSLSAVGMFSMASSVAAAPLLISSSVDLALAPIYFRRRVTREAGFEDRLVEFSRVYLAALFPVWVFCIVFGPNIMHTVAHGLFQEAVPVAVILFCGSFVHAQHGFLSRQIEYLRQTWTLPLIYGTFAALTIGLTLVFTGRWGILAAAWIVTASDFAVLFFLAIAIRPFEAVHYPLATATGFFAVLVVLAVWVVLREPLPPDIPRIAVKVALVVAAMGVAVFWIWPQRAFLWRLVSE